MRRKEPGGGRGLLLAALVLALLAGAYLAWLVGSALLAR